MQSFPLLGREEVGDPTLNPHQPLDLRDVLGGEVGYAEDKPSTCALLFGTEPDRLWRSGFPALLCRALHERLRAWVTLLQFGMADGSWTMLGPPDRGCVGGLYGGYEVTRGGGGRRGERRLSASVGILAKSRRTGKGRIGVVVHSIGRV